MNTLPMQTDQQLIEEFIAANRYVGERADWRTLPPVEPEDGEE
jgi:hypothetical protein